MQSLEECLKTIRPNERMQSRVYKEASLLPQDDTLLHLLVTTSAHPNYYHRENVDGNHNMLLYFLHRGDPARYAKALGTVVDEQAVIPQRLSGGECNQMAQSGDDKIYLSRIDCGFELRELDGSVRKKMNAALQALEDEGLIAHATHEAALQQLQFFSQSVTPSDPATETGKTRHA